MEVNKKSSLVEQATSFLSSVTTYVKKGMPDVDKETYGKRMNICNTCEERNHTRCGVCGCVLAVKCKWETEKCPIKKW
jgi:hypothetical protein